MNSKWLKFNERRKAMASKTEFPDWIRLVVRVGTGEMSQKGLEEDLGWKKKRLKSALAMARRHGYEVLSGSVRDGEGTRWYLRMSVASIERADKELGDIAMLEDAAERGKLIPLASAAKVSALSEETIWNWMKGGWIKGIRIGHGWWFWRREVLSVARRRKKGMKTPKLSELNTNQIDR